MTRHFLSFASIVAIAGTCALSAQLPAKTPVLIITMDTTRADKLGCYGNKSGLTPTLDAFAQKSVLFEHCETAIPLTVPSHTTIFSGLDPISHGVRKNLDNRIPATIPLLQDEMQKAGYATGAFVSSFVLLGRWGMERGFSKYDDAFNNPRRPDETERTADKTLAAALPWILSQTGAWYCWIHLYDPHYPYVPPEPYLSLHKGQPYDGEIAFMDAQLGAFFQKLQAAGVLDKMLVVVCSDHGEALGEHGEATHGVFLYDASTRVVLMVHLPGQADARRVPTDVGLVDVAPTVRALMGLPPEKSDGISLVPSLYGRGESRGPVYMECLAALDNYGWAPLYATVKERQKYILAPKPELYSLDKDPGELSNVLSKEMVAAKPLRSWLQGRIARQPAGDVAAKLALDKEELKSLQSLGYISGTQGRNAGSYRDPKDMAPLLPDIEKAEILLQKGEQREAVLLLEKVIPKDPGNPLFHYQLGTCYILSDKAKAEAELKKALQLRPDFSQAYEQLLLLWITTGRSEEALKLGQSALKTMDDYNGMIHALTGYAAIRAGRPAAEARALLDGGIRDGVEAQIALKGRALLAVQESKNDEAIAYLQKLAENSQPSYMASIGKDPRFAPLHEDARFWKIILTAQNSAR